MASAPLVSFWLWSWGPVAKVILLFRKYVQCSYILYLGIPNSRLVVLIFLVETDIMDCEPIKHYLAVPRTDFTYPGTCRERTQLSRQLLHR